MPLLALTSPMSSIAIVTFAAPLSSTPPPEKSVTARPLIVLPDAAAVRFSPTAVEPAFVPSTWMTGWPPRVRLGGAVDGHRLRDRGQGREQVDRLHAAAGDVEADGVRSLGGIGADDRLAESAGPAVIGVGDGEGREHLAALERLDGEAPAALLEAAGRSVHHGGCGTRSSTWQEILSRCTHGTSCPEGTVPDLFPPRSADRDRRNIPRPAVPSPSDDRGFRISHRFRTLWE